MTPFAQYVVSELQDYVRRAPSEECARMDGEIAREEPCEKCGGRMEYHPYSKPGSYRPFAVCTKCGHFIEF